MSMLLTLNCYRVFDSFNNQSPVNRGWASRFTPNRELKAGSSLPCSRQLIADF
jgi:hypothetical protein